MTLAQGPGNRITGGGLGVCAYARVYAVVQPLFFDATGAPLADPGTVDSNGQYLHVRYSGNWDLGARSGPVDIPGGVVPIDYVQNKIVVEFDAQSYFTCPFEGMLELVGGKGQYKFGWFVHDVVDKQFYSPELRTLRTFRQEGVPFVVPDFHTYILGSNTGDQFLLPTGDTLEPSIVLPGSNIMAGLPLFPIQTTTIITGWKG